MLEAIKSLFITEAFAMAPPAGGGGGGGGDIFASMLPLIIIFAIFYFLLIRPQQKKQKDHKAMLEAVKKGDKVVTTGGIYGLVEQVGPKTLTLKIADGVKVKFGKAYVAALRSTSDEE
jgi:preprotein translocase subunit YajC